MTANYTYMDPDTLVSLLDDIQERNSIAIIDCRDEDRHIGCIINTTHIPSHTQSEACFYKLAKELKNAGVKRVVFHCALSQVRGPRAANRFAAILRDYYNNENNNNNNSDNNNNSEMEVFVLRGGWDNFYATYGVSRQDLIVRFDN